MNGFAIKHLVSGGIITNYFCTSSCGHCLYRCGPEREKNYIDPETAEMNFITVLSYGCKSVHIGGGEPMLRPDELGEVLEAAGRTGVFIEYVETNSSWFKDPDSAADILLKLRKKGLRTLLISISPFHNEFIPASKVTGVVNACVQAGINIFPWIEGFIDDLSVFDQDSRHSLEEYAEKFGNDYLVGVLRRYWVHMGGRALDTFRPLIPLKTPEQIINENKKSCFVELSEVSHFHIDLFGSYIPGLCSGLSIRRADLGRPLSEDKYPLITILVDSGIQGIFRFAQEKFGYSPELSAYINKCDLCTEIRRFLFNKNYGRSELKPKEFYA